MTRLRIHLCLICAHKSKWLSPSLRSNSPLQSLLNSSARLIDCLPELSHISFMFELLHDIRFPLGKFRILVLVFKSRLGLASKYLMQGWDSFPSICKFTPITPLLGLAGSLCHSLMVRLKAQTVALTSAGRSLMSCNHWDILCALEGVCRL